MAGDALLGREMGRYRIESIIGSGGFATVYRAIDLALERPIALKVVDPTAHRNPTIGRRFVLEGRAVASLDHPAIVPVYDAGESDGVLWMAMRLIAGGSLDDALVAGRRFGFEQIAAVVARIGDALDHAHGHGVVHRDVKPSNILLEQNDPARAWLADFGIAATTRTAGRYTTGALGTAAYMAPEQARPSSVGPPADLYSLGCVTYELLARRRPFPGDDYVELLVAHATHPVPPTVWPGVDAFLQRALAKDPAARPPSGRAFAQDLRRTLIETERTRPAPSPAAPATAPSPANPASPPASPAIPPQPSPPPAAATGSSAEPPAAAAAASVAASPPAADRAANAAASAPPAAARHEPGAAGASPGAEAQAAAPPPAQAGPASATPPQPQRGAGAPEAGPAAGASPGAEAGAAENAGASGTARPPMPPPHRPGDPIGPAARAAAQEGETAPADLPPKPSGADETGAAVTPPARPAAAKGPDPDTTRPMANGEAALATAPPNTAAAPAVAGQADTGRSGDTSSAAGVQATGPSAAATSGGPGAGSVAAGAARETDTRPPPPRRDEPPTVVEHVNKTLEHPHLRPPPPTSPPPGWTGTQHRPSTPSSPPGGLRPPPPRDPTVARRGRRRGRQLLIVGGALLVVGIVAVAAALLEQQRNQDNTDSVEDPAGITYEVPTDWEPDDSQAPLVVFERDGSRTATITHRPTDDPEAVGQLDDAGVCEGEAGPGSTIDGADQVAECRNTSLDRPKRAIGAVANGEFWVITVDQAASDAEGDDFIASIEFTTPG